MEKDLDQKLIEKSINPTAMRLLVFDYLRKQDYAISLTDIEKGLAPADRITIYRTLKTFEQKGLVHAIDDGSGTHKYAICQDHCSTDGHYDLHIHFYCNACNETFCLPKSKVPEVTLPKGFQFEELNLVVKGVCSRCAK